LRFHIPRILEHISAWHTLLPGDIVTLGTASSTKEWPMREADMNRLGGPVRIVFERIGTLENPVVRSADRTS
jgi:2-keto-4-pentenoate hydratase/2-oxohepta-3-ene-1,7-dioic acid hydratase in catechol pathway